MSPQKLFLQNKNAFSQETEIFKNPLVGGRQDETEGSAASPPPGAVGAEQQAVFLQSTPGGGKKMKEKEASKASEGHQQIYGREGGLPLFTQLSSSKCPDKVTRNPRYREENGIWTKNP